MSPEYLKGIRRILTVSADTEFVSAPAYLRAAQHAPALNNFGSAMSIVQDELAHAHIGYRLLGDLGVDMDRLIYERPAAEFKYPYAFDIPLDSWVELVCANALYDQAGYVLLSDVHESTTFGPWKRALAKVDKEETFHLRHGRTWLKKLVKDPDGKAARAGRGRLDVRPHAGVVRAPGRAQAPRDPARVRLQGQVQRRAAPGVDGRGRAVHGRDRHRRARPLTTADRWVIDCAFPRAFDAEAKRWLAKEIAWDEVIDALEGARADERGLRGEAPARLPDHELPR